MIAWLRRLVIRWFGESHDDKAVMQTWQRPSKDAQPYDYAKARAGARRAKRQTSTGRVIRKVRDEKPDKVTSIDAGRKRA